jgi:hypothetical protein
LLADEIVWPAAGIEGAPRRPEMTLIRPRVFHAAAMDDDQEAATTCPATDKRTTE